ncbi:hypothetical protein M094_2659 [Bacteroides uniformis str. 3978 T3 ii]|uniref:Uncharacterized protein n=1 Tax=Bacteroides uniformis str. 3978 T3 ii TaxID=1339349 RepID=A0A078S103_BACUN|nr:hypothetical protein M094_2659 [Bacteroides uniformis str. 3978 T3 ii]
MILNRKKGRKVLALPKKTHFTPTLFCNDNKRMTKEAEKYVCNNA